jgi:molybdate transport system substrate-binding protein
MTASVRRIFGRISMMSFVVRPERNFNMVAYMKRTLSMTPLACLTCLFAVAIRPASAAEIKVLTTNLFQPGLVELAGQFKQATGHDVIIEAPRGAELTRILASDEPADILLGATAAVDRAVTDGKVAGAKVPVGRTGIAVMVRRGALSKVATAADVKQAVRRTRWRTRPSGQQLRKFSIRWASANRSRTRRVPPARTDMQQSRGRKRDRLWIELRDDAVLDKGLEFVAMLPDELQSYTTYDAAVLARTKARDAANAFIQFITTPAAKQVLAKAGVN